LVARSIRASQVRVMVSANERQVAGDHYKGKARCPHCHNFLEHWDIAWAFRFNCFQYIISKWIFRKKGPEGRHLLSDLEKIKHACEKYIEVTQQEEDIAAGYAPDENMAALKLDASGEPGPEYVDQDRT